MIMIKKQIADAIEERDKETKKMSEQIQEAVNIIITEI